MIIKSSDKSCCDQPYNRRENTGRTRDALLWHFRPGLCVDDGLSFSEMMHHRPFLIHWFNSVFVNDPIHQGMSPPRGCVCHDLQFAVKNKEVAGILPADNRTAPEADPGIAVNQHFLFFGLKYLCFVRFAMRHNDIGAQGSLGNAHRVIGRCAGRQVEVAEVLPLEYALIFQADKRVSVNKNLLVQQFKEVNLIRQPMRGGYPFNPVSQVDGFAPVPGCCQGVL